jgi:HSP20 family protein
MTLMKIDHNLFPRLTNMWEDFLAKEISDVDDFCTNRCSIPAVNVVETPNHFRLHLAAPGMRREDFKVHVDNGVLTIAAENKEEHTIKEKDSKVTRKEFCYLNFKRSFTLPESVDSEKIEAAYENGILTITIPKHEKDKVLPVKQISIR